MPVVPPRRRRPPRKPAAPTIGSILRLDPAFDALVPKDAQIEKLAGGFTFIEGPLWRPSNALWFSDVVGNVVRQWTPDGKVTEILRPGGYDGNSLPADGFNGPNGMTADKDGAVLLCQHGNRRIARIDKDMKVTTLVDKFEGKKFNSPNDLVFRSDGSLYFTDPPYGLPKGDDDPTKELKFNGVFRLANGKLQAIVKDLTRPNGIALSPDEKTLYVAVSDEAHKVWMRYDLAADGTVSNGKVFADVTAEKEDGLPDGMKVDSLGQRLRERSRRNLGILSGWQAPGHDQAAGDAGQLRLGRRWQVALHYRPHRAVPDQARRCRREAGLLDLDSRRRDETQNIFAGNARRRAPVSRAARAADSAHPILLHVDLSVDPAKEKEMLHNFETIFRPAAVKHPGIHRCEDAEAAFDADGQGSGGRQLSVRADLSKRRTPAEVGGLGDAPESVADHREHALDEELHRDAV